MSFRIFAYIHVFKDVFFVSLCIFTYFRTCFFVSLRMKNTYFLPESVAKSTVKYTYFLGNILPKRIRINTYEIRKLFIGSVLGLRAILYFGV